VSEQNALVSAGDRPLAPKKLRFDSVWEFAPSFGKSLL
jgi:hypothetical protein